MEEMEPSDQGLIFSIVEGSESMKGRNNFCFCGVVLVYFSKYRGFCGVAG